MKLKLNVLVSDEYQNKITEMMHTGVSTMTHSKVHEVEIEIPDLPRGFEVQSITIKANN